MPLPSCLRLAAGAGGGDDDTAEARLHPAVEAVARPGGLGFAFSGGGFLAPYHIGVADSLERCGVLKRDSPLGGASAGSLVAATFRAGMPIESMMSEFLVLAADLRASGTVRKLGATLQAHLERVLPHDSHERLGGSTHIAVTTLRRFPRVLRRELLSSFACRDDLIHSLLASCHLPLYSAGSVAHLHGKRAVRMIDGGVTDLIPVPTSAAHTVKVSCVPEHFISRMPILNKREALRDLAICLGRYEPWPYTFKQMVRAAKAPADVPFLLVRWASDLALSLSFLFDVFSLSIPFLHQTLAFSACSSLLACGCSHFA